MLAWIVLFDPPLCMGIAMLTAGQKYRGAYLGAAHKSVHKSSWRINQHGQDVNRHGQDASQCGQDASCHG